MKVREIRTNSVYSCNFVVSQELMQKGFTLVELLIVIAILAILASAVVLVLNPAELLRQARDSQRISDLSNLRSAYSLYLAIVSTPELGNNINCYVNAVEAGSNCGGRHATTSRTTIWDADRTVDGTGWIPVNLNNISGGSPLAVLPIDPINNAIYFYSYAPDNTAKTFELNANMESARYGSGGANDVGSQDGGDMAGIYEIGTDPGLDL